MDQVLGSDWVCTEYLNTAETAEKKYFWLAAEENRYSKTLLCSRLNHTDGITSLSVGYNFGHNPAPPFTKILPHFGLVLL